MVKIKYNLKEAQDRQKSYSDKNMTTREFKVGEHVLLKVNPKKSSLNLESCTNLAAKSCGPFEIFDRIGSIAYMFIFPASLNVHSVFHVFLLKKYVHNPNHDIDWHLIQVELEGYFHVQLVCILDIKVKVLQNQVIELVKVEWTFYGLEDATWDNEHVMRVEYP
jgi:hypothetical protein